jgi:hypothetical protein
MLQAPSRGFESQWSFDFFNLPNLFTRIMALGFTQPLTELSARNAPLGGGGVLRPVRKADNLTSICEPIV